MKTILALVTLIATCFAAQAVPSVIGGPLVNPANNHVYYLLSQSSWTDAEAYSQTLGGHLAAINDANEQNWVYSTFSTLAGGDNTLWIGLNDVASEGNFVWTTGEPLTYSNWSPGEPNNFAGVEDYGSIFRPSDPRAGSWNDTDNFYTLLPSSDTRPAYGVVEVVPEPSGLALFGLGAIGFAAFRGLRKQP